MKIFAKKCFMLRIGNEKRQTKPLVIQDIPDKFAKSPMFKAGVAAGDIEVLATIVQQKEAEGGEREMLMNRAAEMGLACPQNISLAKLRKAVAEAVAKATKKAWGDEDDPNEGDETDG